MKQHKIKQEEADERQKAYKALTILEKIKKLDEKLGIGNGAKKQREKLAKMLVEENKKGKKEA